MNGRCAVSINDFCRQYSLGRTKTYELIGNGDLPVIKVGKKTLIRTSDADALLEKFKTNPGKPGKPTSKPEAAE